MVKNLTVALDDKSYRKAKIAAARRGISVSALVRNYFNSLDGEAETTASAPKRVPSLVDLIGREEVADLEWGAPKLDEPVRPADLS